MKKQALLALATLAILVPAEAQAPERPLIIAHRGASGYLPEHTLEAYMRALEMGADYIEPDLVPTKDGVLIARHENNITDTTDVAQKFPDRKRTKTIDGQSQTGWFSEDFTLAEIKTLRAKERLFFRNQGHNGQYEIPTLEEVLQLAQAWQQRTGKQVGLYPETKHPTYFRTLGLPLEERLVKQLQRFGYSTADSPVFIQSFEVGNLRYLKTLTDVRLVQLIDGEGKPYDWTASGDKRSYRDMLTPAGLQEVATYAAGIGPYKELIITDGLKGLKPPTPLVRDAHAAGLVVHPWTFRNEPIFLARGFHANPAREYEAFFRAGVDGVFSEFPDTALEVRTRLFDKKN
jgi:glycerophosphoryl diester phosphodiesterase